MYGFSFPENFVTNFMNKQNFSNHSGYYPGINPNDDEYAAKTYANIIRGEYADYVNRFQPYEQRMMSLAESSELLDQQLSRITTNINNAYGNQSLQDTAINMQRFGVQQNQAQQNYQARQTDINRAMSIAHAKNNTRVAAEDRKFGLVTGGSGQRQMVKQDYLGG